MQDTNIELVAHLLRRAGFGANRDELASRASDGYEATVEELLNPKEEQRISDYLVRRFHPEFSGMMGPFAPGENWLYRMATTTAPLQEKMTLFWHGIFATGYNKVTHARRCPTRHGCSAATPWAASAPCCWKCPETRP